MNLGKIKILIAEQFKTSRTEALEDYRLMQSDYLQPLNLGQDRLITVDELVDIIAKIAGKKITKKHNLSKPQGVRGRNSDNTKLRKVLGWEPQISLE